MGHRFDPDFKPIALPDEYIKVIEEKPRFFRVEDVQQIPFFIVDFVTDILKQPITTEKKLTEQQRNTWTEMIKVDDNVLVQARFRVLDDFYIKFEKGPETGQFIFGGSKLPITKDTPDHLREIYYRGENVPKYISVGPTIPETIRKARLWLVGYMYYLEEIEKAPAKYTVIHNYWAMVTRR